MGVTNHLLTGMILQVLTGVQNWSHVGQQGVKHAKVMSLSSHDPEAAWEKHWRGCGLGKPRGKRWVYLGRFQWIWMCWNQVMFWYYLILFLFNFERIINMKNSIANHLRGISVEMCCFSPSSQRIYGSFLVDFLKGERNSENHQNGSRKYWRHRSPRVPPFFSACHVSWCWFFSEVY